MIYAEIIQLRSWFKDISRVYANGILFGNVQKHIC